MSSDGRFEVETMAHGKITFDNYTVWRSELINHGLIDLEKTSANEVANIVAKYSIYGVEGKLFNGPEDKENLKGTKISLTHSELSEFAVKFLEANRYLIGEDDGRYTVSFGNGEEQPLGADEKLTSHAWPADPVEKLKEALTIERKDQEAFVKRTLGLGNFSSFQKIAGFAKKQSDILSGLIPPVLTRPAIVPMHDNGLDESLKRIEEAQKQTREHRLSVDSANLEVPGLLKDLIELQRDMYRTSTGLQKEANHYLDEQIGHARKESRSAGRQSTLAIVVASLSVVAALVLGVIQISISVAPNEQTREQIRLLEAIRDQNDKILNTMKASDTKIGGQLTDLSRIDYHQELQKIYTELVRQKHE